MYITFSAQVHLDPQFFFTFLQPGKAAYDDLNESKTESFLSFKFTPTLLSVSWLNLQTISFHIQLNIIESSHGCRKILVWRIRFRNLLLSIDIIYHVEDRAPLNWGGI